MNWFKRLCLFVFSLSGLASLAAFSLTYAGPWQSQARTLILETRWYYYALCVLVCITAVGLLLCLLRSLFAPRNPRETIVAQVEGGDITVTRAAIVSQTRYIIEGEGDYIASSIHVKVRKRGHVRVNVRVKPRHPVDVVASGEELYAKLAVGLAKICGDSVQSIDLVFTDPEQLDDGMSVGVDMGEKPRSSQKRSSASTDTTVSLPTSRLATPTQEEEPSSELTVAIVSDLPKNDVETGASVSGDITIAPKDVSEDKSAEEA